MCACMLSCSVVSDSATVWAAVYPTPLSMGFPRQEYWSGLPFSFPGALEPWDPACVFCISCIADRFFTVEPSGRPGNILHSIKKKNELDEQSHFQSPSLMRQKSLDRRGAQGTRQGNWAGIVQQEGAGAWELKNNENKP